MYEIKNLSQPVMDISDRRVKVAYSEVDSVDLDNEIIADGAFNKTFKERGPLGANLIWHLTDHVATLKTAVGKPVEVGMSGKMVYGITDIPKTNWGNDVLEFYKTGAINQHSHGFATVSDVKPKNEKQPRIITELKQYEFSAVLWGAHPNTPTISVGKGLTFEDLKSEFDSTMDEFELLTKAIRGKFTDETAELIEIRVKLLEQKLRNIFAEFKISTQAVAETPGPVNEVKLLDSIHLSLLKLF